MDSKTLPEYLKGGPHVPVEYKYIIYEPGKVTRLIFNRPRYKNAISHPMYAEIEHAFERAAADPDCRVLVVSGAGANFSSGHDVVGGSPDGAPVLDDGVPPEELRKRFRNEKEMWRAYWEQHNWYAWEMHPDRLYAFPKPTIAMIHGYTVFGGALIAEMMDLVFATEDALILGFGGGPEMTYMSPRRILEISYEHRFVTGQEAHEYGMVSRVYPDYQTLEKETLAFANRVAENPLPQLMHIKAGMHRRIQHQGYPMLWKEGLRETAWQMLSGTATAGRASIEAPDPKEANRQRYEGKGQARAPRAMKNLKTKLESEGRPIPKVVQDAVARFEAQDPTEFWRKALHQNWRDPENVKKAEEHAKLYDEIVRKGKEGKG